MATGSGSGSPAGGGHGGAGNGGRDGNASIGFNGYYGYGYGYPFNYPYNSIFNPAACAGLQRNQATVATLQQSIAQCNASGTCSADTMNTYQQKLNATVEATASVLNQCRFPNVGNPVSILPITSV